MIRTLSLIVALSIAPSVFLKSQIAHACDPQPYSRDQLKGLKWGNAVFEISDFHPVLPLGVSELDPQAAPKIFRGARPADARAIDDLVEAGIGTDIDLQGGDGEVWVIGSIMKHSEPGERPEVIAREKAAIEAAGRTFLPRPLNSYLKISLDEEKTIDDILEVMGDPRYQPVYVHCEHGHDRTGMIVALYRVSYESWTLGAAHAEMVRLGHKGFIDHIFTHAMDAYFYKEGCRIRAKQRLSNPKLAMDPECARKKYTHVEMKKGAELLRRAQQP